MAGTVTALTFQKRNPDRVSVYLDGKFVFGLAALDAAQLKRGQFLSDDEIADLQRLGLRSKAYDRAVRFLAVRPRSELEVRQNLQRYRPNRKRRRNRPKRRGKSARMQETFINADEDVDQDVVQDTEGNLVSDAEAVSEPERSVESEREEAQQGLPPDLIDWVLQKLIERGYVDDKAFAQFWIEQRNQFKPMAPRAIRYELQGKGVDQRIIETLLNEQVDPESAALTAARSRSQRWRQLDYDQYRKKMAGFLQRRGFAWSVVKSAIETTWQELQTDEADF